MTSKALSLSLFPHRAQAVCLFSRCLFMCADLRLHHSALPEGHLTVSSKIKKGRGPNRYQRTWNWQRGYFRDGSCDLASPPWAMSINLPFYSWLPREKIHTSTKAKYHQSYHTTTEWPHIKEDKLPDITLFEFLYHVISNWQMATSLLSRTSAP